MTTLKVLALGIKREKKDSVLDVYYPHIQVIKESVQLTCSKNVFSDISEEMESFFDEDITSFKTISQQPQSYCDIKKGYYYTDDLNLAIQTAEEAYLKLHLISKRLVKPHEINLEGLFGILTNVAWTNKGPILPTDLDSVRLQYIMSDQPLVVSHIDKFPYMINYHVPSGVRIAAGSQVRLGAYLGEGTTVMPAGYINFNAGTLGHAMVEGRVSAGVVVGEKSDIGGGASIMGTLSGGNKTVISIGDQCLLGANSGTGISLGTGCTIGAGVYITAAMPIFLYDNDNNPINLNGDIVNEPNNCVKGEDLSGKTFLLFIQDSKSGKVICKPNKKLIQLNNDLHNN